MAEIHRWFSSTWNDHDRKRELRVVISSFAILLSPICWDAMPFSLPGISCVLCVETWALLGRSISILAEPRSTSPWRQPDSSFRICCALLLLMVVRVLHFFMMPLQTNFRVFHGVHLLGFLTTAYAASKALVWFCCVMLSYISLCCIFQNPITRILTSCTQHVALCLCFLGVHLLG